MGAWILGALIAASALCLAALMISSWWRAR